MLPRKPRRVAGPLRALLLFILALGWSAGLPAQETFRRQSPPLEVHYPLGLRGGAERLGEVYPRLLKDIETKLGLTYARPLKVCLVRSHEEFQAEVRRHGGGDVSPDTQAIAFSFIDIIVLKSEAWRTLRVSSMEVVFEHEIFHCVLGDFLRRNPKAVIPTWLNEGLAQWVSEEPYKNDGGTLATALRTGDLASLSELDEAFPEGGNATALAYAQSLSFVRFLSRRNARNEIRRGNLRALLRQLSLGKRVDEALEDMTGQKLEDLEKEWRGEVARDLDLSVRRLPEIAFAVFVLVSTLLIWSTIRERRRRAYAEMERQEAAESELTPIDD